jgi:P27 family predicted phage terminase small subunit
VRGHTRKLPDLKKLHGSNKPVNHDEPIPEGPLTDEAPPPPDYFVSDQRAAWHYAIENSPPTLLKRLDVGILESYVVALCFFRRAVAEMRDRPLLTENSLHQTVSEPLLLQIARWSELARKHGSELGFSPLSRPRIFAAGPKATPLGKTLSNASRSGPKDGPKRSLEDYLSDASAPLN